MNKSLLLTGASGGIGVELLEGLSNKGWDVIATDHPTKKLNLTSTARKFSWIPQDLNLLIGNKSIQNNFKKKVINASKEKEITVIIHNAATQIISKFNSLTDNDWQKTFNINLFAPVVINKLFLETLERNKGSIVHISSIHSELTKSNFSAYASSKSALSSLTRSMAIELGKKIRVNAIEPAAINTPMLKDSFKESNLDLNLLSDFHPTGKIGTPNDVLKAILYLIDPKNTFLNGCIISLSGGIHGRLYDPT